MPFALIGVGVLLILTGINNTYSQMFGTMQADFLAGYFKWALGILIVGALGYIPPLKPVSDGLLALIILVLFLASKGGIFTSAQKALSNIKGGSGTSLLPLPAPTK